MLTNSNSTRCEDIRRNPGLGSSIWAINIAKFIPYAFLGMFTVQTGLANLALAPFALLGAWLGVKAHHMVPERAFFALTYVLLVVTGTKLIWDGLT